MFTTFRKLKEADACAPRYKYLANKLGGIKKYGEDTPIPALQILDICGVQDCLWAAPLMPNDRLWWHFAADCAERVLPIFEAKYPDDIRPRKAIQAARDYAEGLIGQKELAAAWDAAWNAAGNAQAAAGVSGEAAAWASGAAAWAAGDSAGYAAWAAGAAAWAAWDAAWAAAGDAAGDAAWAARAAGDAAWDARAAAGDTELQWQTERLRWYLTECEFGPKQGDKNVYDI